MSNNAENNIVKIELTVFESNLLLDELKHAARFVNRDATIVKHLYEKIGTQLNGGEEVTLTIVWETEPDKPSSPPNKKIKESESGDEGDKTKWFKRKWFLTR